MRRQIPVAQRVHDEGHEVNFKLRGTYAVALYADADATLDDLREAVATLEDAERIKRRVLGGAHPFVAAIEGGLRRARAVLRASEATQRG